MSAATRASELGRAQRQRRFVRLSRRFEASFIHGYVRDVGPRFFLLSLVSHHLWFDGFECLRIADVKGVRPDPHAAFAEAALQARKERWPRKPSIDLASTEELLLSAGRSFPLVTIHRERVDDQACHIGKVISVAAGRVELLEIGPDAAWDEQPTSYRIAEITRIDFGGDYEAALHLVGGRARQGYV